MNFKIDLALFTPVLILVILSLATLFSINIELFKSQLFFVGISLIAFVIFSQINYKILPRYDFVLYGAAVVCLFIVLLLGIQSHGAVRWVDIFGIRLQFSELFKPFLLLALASFLLKRPQTLKTLLWTVLLFAPIAFLIYRQPDLGNTVIYSLVLFFVLLSYGFSLVWFGVALIVSLGIIPIFWHTLHEYQRQRILTFLYPSKDPLGTSYNAIQSIIAVGSGMLFGKGLSVGTQSALRFLPERHTDFIFATLSEDLGFVGSSVIIICFALLLFRIYVIFSNCENPMEKLFICGAFFLLLTQFFMNIGMNVGILPIVGVTLPFVSYGGSSLLSSFILLGLVNAFANEHKRRDILEIR